MSNYEFGEFDRRIANLLRIGNVCQFNGEGPQVRVDLGGVITDWIFWGERRAGKIKTWSPPSIGEQVLIGSPHGDLSQAVVICSLPSDKNPAPSTSSDQDISKYDDGTEIAYDIAKHALSAQIGGTSIFADRSQIKFKVGGVTFLINSSGVDIQGGKLTHNGKNVGSDHAHGGIVRGDARTDGPS